MSTGTSAASIPRSVVVVLPDLGTGGAQRVMNTIAGALAARGVTVTLVVVDGTGPDVLPTPDGVAVVRLGASRLRSAIPALIAAVRRIDPEITISVMGYLNLALAAVRPLLGGTRLILREANRLSVTRAALPPPLSTLGYRWLYPRADRIIAPTARIAAEIAQAAPTARIAEIANPVEAHRLRVAARIPNRIPGPGLRIVAAGRLTEAKGFDRLIAAMALLPPDARAIVYGEGSERPRLEGEIARLGLEDRIRMPGYDLALPAAIAGADVFALPSRVEGLPNVGLEALALGTPVVAWSTAEMDGVDAVAGAVREVDTVDDLAAALRSVEPAVCTSPRHSLLGHRYETGTVTTRWLSEMDEP